MGKRIWIFLITEQQPIRKHEKGTRSLKKREKRPK
jgi:hypothetical protein